MTKQFESLDAFLRSATQRSRIGLGDKGIRFVIDDGVYAFDGILKRIRADPTDTITDRSWPYLLQVSAGLREALEEHETLRANPRIRTDAQALRQTLRELCTRLARRVTLESISRESSGIDREPCLIGALKDHFFSYCGQYVVLNGREEDLSIYFNHATFDEALVQNQDAAIYTITDMPRAMWCTFPSVLSVLCERCEMLRAEARTNGSYPYLPPLPRLLN